MGRNLSNLFISSSYQFLTQISGSELQTGLGDKITGSLEITSSKADTATSASFASTAVSSSYSTTALSASYAITSTSSSVAINATSASYAVNSTSASIASTATSASYATNALSSSFAITASYALNAGVTVSTASLLTTASAANNVITFTKGDASTFTVTVDTGSAVSTNTGSLLVTASISNATTTFTKGDGSTFSVTANNVVNADSASLAANATSASFATTTISASYATNALSASQAANANTATSASFATTATSASFASTIPNGLSPTFANVTASNVMITGTASVALLYTQTVTSSVVYSSGSNQFGDASNDVQTLYGTVDIKNGPVRITGSLNVSGSVTGNVLGNNTDTFTSSAAVQQVVTLTQTEYNGITPDANTLYIISGSTPITPVNTSSFATTGSNTFNGNQIISGSLTVTSFISGSVAKIGELTISTPGGVNNNNTFVGRGAGNSISTEKNSTLIGSQAGFASTGTDNVAVGYQAMFGEIGNNTSGSQNTAVGVNAGLQIKNGSSNVAVGYNAMYTIADFPPNANASNNTVVGHSAAKKLYFGDNNTVVGASSGQLINTGSNNTIVGANYSGSDFDNTVVLTDGQGNVQFYATGGLATFTNITASSINATSFTGSLLGTSSYATNALSASYAPASPAFPYTGSAEITGSLGVTGSATITGLLTVNNSASADYWLVDNKPFARLDTNTIVAGRIDGADEDFVLAGRNFNGTAPAITMTDGVFVYNESAHEFTGSVSMNGTLTVKNDSELSGSVRGEVRALSISSNTASLDLSTGNFFTLTLVSGSNTFINPSNINPGQTINLRIKQASVASGSISFASSVKQVSGSSYIPTATANGEDVVTFISFDSTNLYLSNVKNFV